MYDTARPKSSSSLKLRNNLYISSSFVLWQSGISSSGTEVSLRKKKTQDFLEKCCGKKDNVLENYLTSI